MKMALVPVVALTKMMMKRLPAGGRDYANLATVMRAGERARDLVLQILAFSRKDTPTRELVDMTVVLLGSLRMLRASIPSTIAVEERIDSVPLIGGDPAQLRQVITNLAINAAQAIGAETGTITIGVAVDPASPLPLCLTVRDTGCGMAEATLRRTFEPFFTTKRVGEATGLGLSVVRGIVKSHGGDVTNESRPGSGTTVVVKLPVPIDTSAAEDRAPPG